MKVDWLRGQITRKEERTRWNALSLKLNPNIDKPEQVKKINLNPILDNNTYVFDCKGKPINVTRRESQTTTNGNFNRLMPVYPFNCSEEITVEKSLYSKILK